MILKGPAIFPENCAAVTGVGLSEYLFCMKPPQPWIEELTPPPDPWQVARNLSKQRKLLFFDSAGGPAELARYSYVLAEPFAWLEARGSDVFLNGERQHGDPFSILARELKARERPTIPGFPPFQGGAAGLFGYDLCHWLERLPHHARDEFQCPDMAIGFYDQVVAWDHVAKRAWWISWRTKNDRINGLSPRWFDSNREAIANHHSPLATHHSLPIKSNFTRNAYIAAVQRAIEYVHAGDCFQVNLAQQLQAPAICPPLQLYGRLRQCNPAPFVAYFDIGAFQILSASPERFMQLTSGGQVITRPIKGTRPRGRNEREDAANRAELLASAKDRAENVMIVDLLRNDLGRVCEYASVRVPEVCRLESYQTVHHLVSEVRGQLRKDKIAVDLLRATFPGGSVTGAPKIRAMEIIAELEPAARGPYCGCLGWIGLDGAMDTNILIRTFTQGRGQLRFPVGGGIVAESIPEREYEETMHKAEGLLRALNHSPLTTHHSPE
jgi:para-aminobenzoate synthetase component 1